MVDRKAFFDATSRSVLTPTSAPDHRGLPVIKRHDAVVDDLQSHLDDARQLIGIRYAGINFIPFRNDPIERPPLRVNRK